MTIRLVVGEDDYLVRQGIERILVTQSDLAVIASCGDDETLRAAITRERPDVVVTDIRMPPTNTDEGIRLAGDAARADPPRSASWCSASTPSRSTSGAARVRVASGRAYLLKERVHDRAQLVGGDRVGGRGGSVIDPKIVEPLVAAKCASSARRSPR